MTRSTATTSLPMRSAGGLTLGGVVPNVELTVFGLLLAQGCTVIVPDTEGQRADFAAGPEYGMNTLDSIRAAFNSPTVGLPDDARVALLGYSGGAIASEWAAELAPTYAPDVNERMIGAAIGGVLVHPAHNLHYVEGTYFWAGVMPMALIGIARAFEVDFMPYLTARGLRLYRNMQATSIVNVLGRPPYWRLKWADVVIPEYPTPESLPAVREAGQQAHHGHRRYADDSAVHRPGGQWRSGVDAGGQAGHRRRRRRDDRRRCAHARPHLLRERHHGVLRASTTRSATSPPSASGCCRPSTGSRTASPDSLRRRTVRRSRPATRSTRFRSRERAVW